jgi:hypothetical protein
MKLNYKNFVAYLLASFATTAQAQKNLFIDKQEYSCATSFDIAVRTKNISNVVALQGSVVWDTAVLRFSNISYGTSAIMFNNSNVNISAAADGYLTFLWFENNIQPQAVPDSTVLFIINFTTNGTGRGRGIVNFSGSPTTLEIDTVDTEGLPVNDLSAVFANGYATTPGIYSFTGAGNWDVATNWKNNLIPPAVLPACSEIVIDPAGNAACLLNVPQTIAPGAKLTVVAGKKLVVNGNLAIQQ